MTMNSPRVKSAVPAIRHTLIAFIAVALLATLIAGYTAAWFTDEADLAETKYTAGTVNIEADRIVSDPTGETYTIKDFKVIERDQGLLERGPRYVGERPNKKIYEYISTLEPRYSNPQNPHHFYTVGILGYLILELDEPMAPGTGIREIKIITGGYEDQDCTCDMAEVYVSDDKETWYKVGGTLTGPVFKSVTIEIPESFTFDIKYIKILDKTDIEGFTRNPPHLEHNGYDLFYIECGIRNGDGGWIPGGNNYVDYRINNTGSKNIRLRVKLTGVWQTYDQYSQTWHDTELPTDNVIVTPAGANAANWIPWTSALSEPGVQYYVYNDTLAGNYNGQTPGSAELRLMVTLLSGTGPEYQGYRFVLMPEFEAIQASHSSGVDGNSGWTWENYNIYN